ncbi:hypothetical protein [Streptomyces sp. NPDC015131]|uniref:hypothetical protein n=1 Tax=Streptomyces sp. NPDC015131 TaxID=3364941 RepID=UPI003700D68F
MTQAPPRRRPRPALVRGLATRFALIITDPRAGNARHISCTDDTIDVHYPETRIRCRLRRMAASGRLLCTFHVTHLAPDGSTDGTYHVELALDGATGSPAQREAVLHQLHAYHCAAAASRLRAATRVPRRDRPLNHPADRTVAMAA